MGKDYITIGGRAYRVITDTMGASLAFAEACGGKVPVTLSTLDTVKFFLCCIHVGEEAEGRECDFGFPEFCALSDTEGARIITEFNSIFVSQHPADGSESKKKD